MAQTVKLTLSTLLDILGWHGSFLLLVIISFKLLLERDELFFTDGNPGSCPCTWHVAFGTIMFLFPSLILYITAVFGYFLQDNESVPWKPMKKLYELKSACVNHDGRIAWDVHVEHCAHCQQVRRHWTLVKIAISATLSLLYPLVWLSLSFLQTNYYVCALAGPRQSTVRHYCYVARDKRINFIEYEKKYALAFIRSKVIGSIFFVVTLFFLGLFLILYGEIANHLRKIESSRGGPKNTHPLKIHVAILPGGRSSEAVDTGRRPGETAEAVGQSTDKNKSIHINLSDEFTTTLRGCFQEGAWQGIDVHCSQQDENWSRQGSYVAMRPQSAGPLYQRFQADHTSDLAPLVLQETRDSKVV